MTEQLRSSFWFVVPRSFTASDTMEVIPSGAIGCSMNRLKVLQHGSQPSDISRPILATLMEISAYSLVFKSIRLTGGQVRRNTAESMVWFLR